MQQITYVAQLKEHPFKVYSLYKAGVVMQKYRIFLFSTQYSTNQVPYMQICSKLFHKK